MSTSLSNARDIFIAAVKLSQDQWDSFLKQTCGDDDALRQRVHQLLIAHREANSFLEPAQVSDTLEQPPPVLIGTHIGPYKLLQQIGEGGMGIVYLAEQSQPVHRKVALKIIKPGLDSKQVIARFEAERQALAMMDHVNIARVIDGGTTGERRDVSPPVDQRADAAPLTGRPYFVMELVHGIPITKYCDENHLTPRERLELFIPVCQAIQHAHQKGIIHRDIKPSNILVTNYDGKPVPKVIDFGVAKAIDQKLTDNTLFTNFGTMVGTLEYMSPEQAEINNLGVDTRSDIYSLGVLLYELLTGSTPLTRKRLKEAANLEILRMIKEEEPQKPSTRISESGDALASISAQRKMEPAKLSKLVRGELDWIVMKTLEKDRNRRYETANGLGRDIQRYLADEAVEACPPSKWYRVKKFVRRNKGPVMAASLVMLALLGGISGTTYGLYAEAQRAEGERQAKLDIDQKCQEAERNLAYAKKGNQLLGSVFAGLSPSKIAESGRPLQDVLKDNLKTAIKELEGSAIGDPLTVADMQATLGISLCALGDYDQAIEVFIKARDTFLNKLGPDHAATLTSMGCLALCYRDAGKLDLALPLLEETVRLMKAKLGADHAATLASMKNLALGYQAAGKLDLALPLLEETVRLMKAKPGADHADTLISMGKLADCYRAAGKLDLALPLLEEAAKLQKAKQGADHPDTLTSMINLALGYQAAGKLEQALPLFEESVKFMKAKLGADHPATLVSINNLATGYLAAGKLELALPLYEETLKLRKAKLGADHPHTLISMNNLARCYEDAEKLELALPLLEETVRLMKAKLGADHPNTLISMNNLATGYKAAGKLELALPFLEETVRLMKAKLGADHPDTLASMNNLAVLYTDAGKLDLALPLLVEVLQLKRTKLGANHPDTLASMNNLAHAYHEAGKLELALPLYEETLKLAKAKMGADHPNTLTSMKNLAQCYEDAGKLDLPLFQDAATRAELLYHRASEISNNKWGPDNPTTLKMMSYLAHHYLEQNQLQRAEPIILKVLDTQRRVLGEKHPDTISTMHYLGKLFRKQGRLSQAEQQLSKSLNLSIQVQTETNSATIAIIRDLANVYADQRNYTKAQLLFEKAIESNRKVRGENHHVTLQIMHDSAASMLENGELDKAETLFFKVVEISKKVKGNTHAHTFERMNALGKTYWLQKKYCSSVAIYQELFEKARGELGMKNIFTIQTMANLGVNYQSAGRINEGIALLENAWTLATENNHSGHADQLLNWVRTELIATYERQGNKDKADEWRKKLPIQRTEQPAEKQKG